MKKKYVALISICAVVFVAGVLESIWVLSRPHGNWVEIVQDSVVLEKIDLSQSEDQIICVEYQERINTVEIKDYQIYMLKAECSDHTCVSMGWLDSSIPIVCLPNHLVIQFADGSKETDQVIQ